MKTVGAWTEDIRAVLSRHFRQEWQMSDRWEKGKMRTKRTIAFLQYIFVLTQ